MKNFLCFFYIVLNRNTHASGKPEAIRTPKKYARLGKPDAIHTRLGKPDAIQLRPFYVAIQIIGVIFYLFNVDIQSISLLSPENQAHKYSTEDILGFLQPYFLSIVIIFLKVLLDNLLLVTGNDRNSSLI